MRKMEEWLDYIARKTKNIRSVVVNQLGKERLEKYMIWQMFTIVIILTGLVMILLQKHISKTAPLTMLENVVTPFRLIGILVKCIRD